MSLLLHVVQNQRYNLQRYGIHTTVFIQHTENKLCTENIFQGASSSEERFTENVLYNYLLLRRQSNAIYTEGNTHTESCDSLMGREDSQKNNRKLYFWLRIGLNYTIFLKFNFFVNSCRFAIQCIFFFNLIMEIILLSDEARFLFS